MPRRPKRPCGHPGCSELTDGGMCQKHKKADDKRKYEEYWHKRDREQQRIYGRMQWRRLRKMVLNEQPLCAHCRDKGKLTAANEVDHIDNNPWNMARDNLQALCKPCHSKKTRAEQGLSLFKPSFKTPSCPVVIVCGPPGAGKTTYAMEQLDDTHDEIIDLDIIKAEITGTSLYERQDEIARDTALSKRNQRLQELHDKKEGRVYFIISAAKKTDREWWQRKLSAEEIILLTVPLEICIERINNDGRRTQQVKDTHIQAAKKWWNSYLSDTYTQAGTI